MPRVPAPSRNLIEPSSGSRAGVSVNSARSTCASPGGRNSPARGGQLDHLAAREGREVLDGPAQRRIDGTSGLVGNRDVDVAARRQRLEQSPLGAGEVLEAVREDRVVAPCLQLSGQPFDRPSAQHSPIPRIEPVEVGAVGPGQRRKRLVQVLRLEQALPRARRARDRRRRHIRRSALRLPALHRTVGAAADPVPRLRAGAAPRRRRRRAPRTPCRRSRWSRPGGHRTVRRARARPVRRRSGSGRSARDRARSRRRTGREAARPSRRAPDRRRGRAPPAHGSRVVLPSRLTSSRRCARKPHRARRKG